MANTDPAAQAALEELTNVDSAPAAVPEEAATGKPQIQDDKEGGEGIIEPASSDSAGGESAPADDQGGEADGESPAQGGDTSVALQEARQKARESREAQRRLEAQLTEYREAQAAMLERIASMNGGQQPAQHQAPQDDPLAYLDQPYLRVPDYLEDAEGHAAALEHNQRVQEAGRLYLQQQRQREAQQQQLTAQQAQQQQFRQQLHAIGNQHAEDFRIQQPDYNDALKFLSDDRIAEYKAMGLDDQQATMAVAQEADQIIARAYRSGQNAAEIAYNLAVHRGYKKAAPPPQPQPQQTTAEQIQQKAQNARQTRSLGAARGGAAGGEMTLEKYLTLSPKEKLDLPPSVVKKMFAA